MAYRIGVTYDLRGEDNLPLVDLGLDSIATITNCEWSFLPPHGPELSPADLRDFDAVLVWKSTITPTTVAAPSRLLHVARLGVGLDSVDVDACTRSGVLVTITPDAVRRPVASGAVALVLALSHRITPLDRIVRTGGWGDRVNEAGMGLTHRTLGIIGLGNIGCELVRLIAPWAMDVLGHDPFVATQPPGVTLTTLDDLLKRSDFVVLTCPLTAETFHLINNERIALMKPTACLINVARGPIVDTDALVEALRSHRLAGAALDVVEGEPLGPDHPLYTFEDVVLSPHSVALTDDFNLAVGRSAIESVRQVATRQIPAHLVNRDAVHHPRIAAWFAH